jgi:hypothetical protein
MNRACVLALALPLCAQDARTIITEVQNRTRTNSQRYEGALQVLDGKNKITEKRWRYERIGSAGNSKVVLRFMSPPEVKGVALLIGNHPDKASDQWMWTPSIARERRIALQDRKTRFFGTDFSFEDLEERDVDQFDFKVLGDEALEGQVCWKIESRPKQSKSSQYSHSYLWVRKDIYAIVQVESFQKEKLIRRLKYQNYQKVQGIWTPLTVEIADVERKSRTVLKTDKLEYNVPLKEDAFTLQALRRDS